MLDGCTSSGGASVGANDVKELCRWSIAGRGGVADKRQGRDVVRSKGPVHVPTEWARESRWRTDFARLRALRTGALPRSGIHPFQGNGTSSRVLPWLCPDQQGWGRPDRCRKTRPPDISQFSKPARAARPRPENHAGSRPDWTCLVKGHDRAAALRALDETSPVWRPCLARVSGMALPGAGGSGIGNSIDLMDTWLAEMRACPHQFFPAIRAFCDRHDFYSRKRPV
ncbi:hypothetical protein SAMN04488568_10312 [Maricaulis salignorans]|uniref:Uncharacterized protein n=1 Tax=Maricaulis salignorans TaxID=144026 RepID=A0A1G9NW06_9PROT|nr:hypothetical protein SAMN04488568_10312 [Maricaulis salignorans]